MAQLKDLIVSGAARFLNGIDVVGDLTLAGNLLPATDRTYDIGSPNYHWKYGYLTKLAIDNIGTTNMKDLSEALYVSGTSYFARNVFIGNRDSSYTLYVEGNTGLRGDLYMRGKPAIIFQDGVAGETVKTSTPTALSYGRLQSYGTLNINGNTDNSGTEYVNITAGHGMSSSTSDGLSVGTNSIGMFGRDDTYKLFVNGTSRFADLITTSFGSHHKGIKIGNTYINAIGGNLILQNNSEIRFGSDSWDYDLWGGIKYTPSSRSLYIGIADKSIFTANNAQTNGNLYVVNSHLLPNGDAAYDVGSSAHRWRDGYLSRRLYLTRRDDTTSGISFYHSSYYTWFDYMNNLSSPTPTGAAEVSYGAVTSWARRSLIENASGYGWIWESAANSNGAVTTPMMALSSSNGNLHVRGAVHIGSSVAGDNNYIAFYGIQGDGAGSYNHTYIGENLFGGSESSELFLFKGKDPGTQGIDASGSGPDRIRSLAAAHLFQVYNTAISGTFKDVAKRTANVVNIFEIKQDGTKTFGNSYVTKQVLRTAISSTWRLGRDNAFLRITDAPKDGYVPLTSIKTTDGSWESGTYNTSGYTNKFLLGYVPDTHYAENGSNSQSKQYLFGSDGVLSTPMLNVNCGTSTTTAYKAYIEGTTRITGRLYENEWIEFSGNSGLYWPNHNGAAHFYPNNVSTYATFIVRGKRGNYTGIHFGENGNYMDIIDNENDKGLFQEGQRWILWYNRGNGKLGLRTSTDFGYPINADGTLYTNDSLYAKNYVRANVTGAGTTGGLSLYGTGDTYAVLFRTTASLGKHGGVQSDWATYFTMSNTTDRGWIFRRGGTNVASVDGTGRGYFDGGVTVKNRGDFSNKANDANYMNSALQIREYNYGGAQADTWAIAPRLSWHWGGRVQSQIGLASNNELYVSKDQFAHAYKLVYETGTWGINISGNANTSTRLTTNASTTSSDPGGLTWFDISATAGSAVNVNDTPTSQWWYILRNRHTNTGNNCYTDLAIPFNGNSIYYKIIRDNAVQNSGWVKVLDRLNFNEFAPTKTGTGASGTWGISINGNAATANGVAPTWAGSLSTSNYVAAWTNDGKKIQAMSWDNAMSLIRSNANGSWGINSNTATSLSNAYTVDSGNTNTYPWHLIAKAPSTASNWVDADVILLISEYYDGGRYGIIKLNMRTNDQSSAANSSASAVWLVRRGFAVDDVYWGLYKNGKNSTADFYVKTRTYSRMTIKILSPPRNMTLYSSSESNNSASPNRAYTSVNNGGSALNGAGYTSTGAAIEGGAGYVLKSGDTMTGQLNGTRIMTSDWFGSTGNSGWWNNTHGGGIYMTDSTWVRIYGNKKFYVSNTSDDSIFTSGGIRVDGPIICNRNNIAITHNNGKSISFGVGSGQNNRGIWNPNANAWMIYTKDDSNYCYTTRLYGAVWNDYAEFRMTKKDIQPGRVIIETGKGDLILSTRRLQAGVNVVSDTYGFAIGETEKTKTPIAVSGRALVYPYEDRETYKPGEAVCSGPDGTVSRMTREEIMKYPERIVGTVSEIPNYETWGTDNVKVNGRIWIKVK